MVINTTFNGISVIAKINKVSRDIEIKDVAKNARKRPIVTNIAR
jgi:hypothetical protein